MKDHKLICPCEEIVVSDEEQIRCLSHYTLICYKNVVFPVQAEYFYFSADFRRKIFFDYS